MGKRTQAAPPVVEILLTRNKADLAIELDKRITSGETILSRQFHSVADIDAFEREFEPWDRYNAELLSQAFTDPYNRYVAEYKNTGPSAHLGGIYTRAETPGERAERVQTKLQRRIANLKSFKERLPLIAEKPGTESTRGIDPAKEALKNLDRIFERFHRVAQSLRHRHSDRETIVLKDEYDVQDLLRGLLALYFDDVREEEYSPSYAGANSRIDFVLKAERIVVETKMTNDGLLDKQVGSQLLIDIGRYRAHPDCETLAVFVYDKLDYIRNKAGLKIDLEKMSSADLAVRVFIKP